MNVRGMSADELFAEANRELIRIIKGGICLKECRP